MSGWTPIKNARLRERRAELKAVPAGGVAPPGRRPSQSGSANPAWKGGRWTSSRGYVLVRVPPGHHLRQAHGGAYEHRLVAEEMLGRRITSDEIVHHRNGNKTDNRPENLEVMLRADHVRHHNAARRHGGRT